MDADDTAAALARSSKSAVAAAAASRERWRRGDVVATSRAVARQFLLSPASLRRAGAATTRRSPSPAIERVEAAGRARGAARSERTMVATAAAAMAAAATTISRLAGGLLRAS